MKEFKNREQRKYYVELKDRISSMSKEELIEFIQELKNNIENEKINMNDIEKRLKAIDDYFNKPTADTISIPLSVASIIPTSYLCLQSDSVLINLSTPALSLIVCILLYAIIRARLLKVIPCSIICSKLFNRLNKLENRTVPEQKILNEIEEKGIHSLNETLEEFDKNINVEHLSTL